MSGRNKKNGTVARARADEREFDFQTDVIDASTIRPVLVDFWAPWCGPCRFLGPILERLSDKAKDDWILVKVNTDEYADLVGRYDIQGIPTVKLFVNGVVIDEFVGALSEDQVRLWLNERLTNPIPRAALS